MSLKTLTHLSLVSLKYYVNVFLATHAYSANRKFYNTMTCVTAGQKSSSTQKMGDHGSSEVLLAELFALKAKTFVPNGKKTPTETKQCLSEKWETNHNLFHWNTS